MSKPYSRTKATESDVQRVRIVPAYRQQSQPYPNKRPSKGSNLGYPTTNTGPGSYVGSNTGSYAGPYTDPQALHTAHSNTQRPLAPQHPFSHTNNITPNDNSCRSVETRDPYRDGVTRDATPYRNDSNQQNWETPSHFSPAPLPPPNSYGGPPPFSDLPPPRHTYSTLPYRDNYGPPTHASAPSHAVSPSRAGAPTHPIAPTHAGSTSNFSERSEWPDEGSHYPPPPPPRRHLSGNVAVTSPATLPVQQYKKTLPPPAASKPDPFASTLALYASTWMRNKQRSASESSEVLPATTRTDPPSPQVRYFHDGDSADHPVRKERMLEIAPFLQVDYNALNDEQFVLTLCYFRGQRTVRQFFYRGLVVVDCRFRLDDVHNSDEESTPQPDEYAKYLVDKNPRYLTDIQGKDGNQPGRGECETCVNWNIPLGEQFRSHEKTEIHRLLKGELKLKPLNGCKRFDMVYCFACSAYFMCNYNSNTIVGHMETKEHNRAAKILHTLSKRLQGSRAMCLLTELEHTKVFMCHPVDCKYQTPKEALASYTRVYHKMSSKGLVVI